MKPTVLCFVVLFAGTLAGPLISEDVALELRSSIDHDIDDRIVGGNEAKIEQHPYLVSVRVNGIHICGGCIINWGAILTAAVCKRPFSRFQNYTVMAGSTSRTGNSTAQIRNVAAFIIHPKYDPYRYENNIAIFYVDKAFIFGANVKSIAVFLPRAPVPYGKNATIAGWGSTDSKHPTSRANELQATTIPISANETCYATYPGLIDNNKLCAGLPNSGRGACFFDNGAPLTINDTLLGLFSWGSGCGATGVYTKVAPYFDWIRGFVWF